MSWPCREGCTQEFKTASARGRHEVARHGRKPMAKQRLLTARKRLPPLELLASAQPGEIASRLVELTQALLTAAQALVTVIGNLTTENRVLRKDAEVSRKRLAKVSEYAASVEKEEAS